jgi:hypothetical protein
LAFPWLYPGGIGDIKESRLFDIEISDWAQNLLYYHDGRFAKDKLWRFFTLNCIYRRRNFSQSQWFVKEFTGNHLPSLEELQQMINDGNLSFIDKLMYFRKIIPGSASYWQSKKAELYSWINHHVEKGRGAPSIFLTLSCAEYFWPDIKRILQDFIKATTRRRIDLNKDFRLLNQVLNDYSLIIQDYFHKKVEFFIEYIGKNVFRMTFHWGRFEFSKGRGQIHLHLVGIIDGVTKEGGIQSLMYMYREDIMKQAEKLADWVRTTFNMTAEFDEDLIKIADSNLKSGQSPCTLRYSEVKDIYQDQVNLALFCQHHSCSDYCLRTVSQKSSKHARKRKCSMGCGEETFLNSRATPGWKICENDLIQKDDRVFKKIVNEIIPEFYKHHYSVYKHGEQIVMYLS